MQQAINWIKRNKKEFVFKKTIKFDCKYSKLGEVGASSNNVDCMDWLIRALYFKKQIIKHKIPSEYPGFRDPSEYPGFRDFKNGELIKQLDHSFLKECISDKEVIF